VAELADRAETPHFQRLKSKFGTFDRHGCLSSTSKVPKFEKLLPLRGATAAKGSWRAGSRYRVTRGCARTPDTKQLDYLIT